MLGRKVRAGGDPDAAGDGVEETAHWGSVPPVQFFTNDRGQRLEHSAGVGADGTADAGVELQGNGKTMLRIVADFGQIAWKEAAVTVRYAERRFMHDYAETVARAAES